MLLLLVVVVIIVPFSVVAVVVDVIIVADVVDVGVGVAAYVADVVYCCTTCLVCIRCSFTGVCPSSVQ